MKSKSDSEFSEIKKKSKLLFLYSYTPLIKMSAYCNSSYGYALFDSEFCLLKLFGTNDFLNLCKANEIKPGTIWTEEFCKTESSPIGMQNILATTYSNNNSNVPYNISFSIISLDIEGVYSDTYNYPIQLLYKKGNTRTNTVMYGAVAIIYFNQKNSNYYSALTEATAREIVLQLHWYNLSSQDTNSNSAFISIDQSKGKNQITIISSNIYEMFDLPKNSQFLSLKLEELFDPLPLNKEFWNIVNSQSIVNSRTITVSRKNNALNVSLSTRRTKEDRYNMKEFVIYLQSLERYETLYKDLHNKQSLLCFDDIIGKSYKFKQIIDFSKKIALTNSNILILGESGVGKDILSQAIHSYSKRNDGPFVAINCAAFSRELIASELFGYEPGAFTGAKKNGSIGKFQLADNGTLFLDEIGDMPLDLQTTLLRVIENKSFMRVGGDKEIKVNVRIIAATNKDLQALVRENKFREDLYYRLSVVKLRIPPLRERERDVLLLSEYFINNICTRFKKRFFYLTDDAKELLIKYDWPGNIRELQNLLEGIICINDSPLITSEMISSYLEYSENNFYNSTAHSNNLNNNSNESKNSYKNDIHLNSNSKIRKQKRRKLSIPTVTVIDRESIISALEAENYNVSKTAVRLNMSRRTLYRRLEEYGLLK